MLHWLIVVPYYFFGAFVLAGLLSVVSRLLRLEVTMDRIATVAVLGSIVGLAALLASPIVRLDDLDLVPLLGLFLASFVLAGLDAALQSSRPLADERATRHGTHQPQIG